MKDEGPSRLRLSTAYRLPPTVHRPPPTVASGASYDTATARPGTLPRRARFAEDSLRPVNRCPCGARAGRLKSGFKSLGGNALGMPC